MAFVDSKQQVLATAEEIDARIAERLGGHDLKVRPCASPERLAAVAGLQAGGTSARQPRGHVPLRHVWMQGMSDGAPSGVVHDDVRLVPNADMPCSGRHADNQVCLGAVSGRHDIEGGDVHQQADPSCDRCRDPHLHRGQPQVHPRRW